MAIDYDVKSWTEITNAAGTAGTSLTATTGKGARFPNGLQYTKAIAYLERDPGICERIAITFRATDSFTIVRNIDAAGAQNIAATGWALRIDHDLVAASPPQEYFSNNINNTTVAFNSFIGVTQPAHYWNTGDVMHHIAQYQLVNELGVAHTFTVTYVLSAAAGGAENIVLGVYAVPANTSYFVEIITDTMQAAAAAQRTIAKETVYNLNTSLLVAGYPRLTGMNSSRDLFANASNIFSVGWMDAASPSLRFYGYLGYTTKIRGS